MFKSSSCALVVTSSNGNRPTCRTTRVWKVSCRSHVVVTTQCWPVADAVKLMNSMMEELIRSTTNTKGHPLPASTHMMISHYGFLKSHYHRHFDISSISCKCCGHYWAPRRRQHPHWSETISTGVFYLQEFGPGI